MAGKKWGKKAAKSAKKQGKRKQNARRNRGVREWATLTESGAPGTLAPNTAYKSYNLSLAMCPRAINVAKSYQFYRIKRVTYVIKPNADTFISGQTSSVPYLYYMIDRTQQFQNAVSPDMLRAAGAKPRRIDEKIVQFSYCPSVLNLAYDNTAGAATNVSYKVGPWLPTKDINQVGVWNPNTTDHQGVVFYIENVGGSIGFTFERRFEIEFKKPIVQPLTGEEHAPEDLDPDLTMVKPLEAAA